MKVILLLEWPLKLKAAVGVKKWYCCWSEYWNWEWYCCWSENWKWKLYENEWRLKVKVKLILKWQLKVKVLLLLNWQINVRVMLLCEWQLKVKVIRVEVTNESENNTVFSDNWKWKWYCCWSESVFVSVQSPIAFPSSLVLEFGSLGWCSGWSSSFGWCSWWSSPLDHCDGGYGKEQGCLICPVKT